VIQYYNSSVKEATMGQACSWDKGNKKLIQNFNGESFGKQLLGGPRI
jgi:hypothetical protein